MPFFCFPVGGAGAQVVVGFFFTFSCTALASLASQISVGLVENALYSFPGEVGIFSVPGYLSLRTPPLWGIVMHNGVPSP